MFIKLRTVIGITAVTVLFSCSLIFLGDIDISIYPGDVYSILAEDEVIKLTFSEPVNQQSFEAAFTLAGVSGNEEGDFIWTNEASGEAQRLVFNPNQSLQPGFLYRIKINGEITSIDGRSFLKKINIPFYYITNDLPPVLKTVSLDDGQITDVNESIVFGFSKAIDQSSFEDGFRLSPSTEWDINWNTEGDQVIISPAEQWLNLQYYSWTLTTEITDTRGIRLPDEYEGAFLVQLDTQGPDLVSIYPAADNKDGSFTLKTVLTADDLLINEHLALSFSEAVDFNSLRQNLSFDPSIDGYLTAINPNLILYYIYEKLPPGVIYKLLINEGLKDLSGNATTSDITRSFTPTVPVQRITSIVIEDENGVFLTLIDADFNSEGFIDTPGLNYYGTDTLHLIINLSEGYPESSMNERLAFEESTVLIPVFPPGTLSPSISLSCWDSENSLRLIYNGLTGCSPGEPVYYEFKITAGNADSANPAGAYLTESVFFRMLAEVN